MKKEPKTLTEKVGSDESLFKLIKLFAEGFSYSEIARKMPELFVTRNAVAGVKNLYKAEIETLLTAYLVQNMPVPHLGNSKSFKKKEKPDMPEPTPPSISGRERDRIIANALVEWKSTPRTFRPFAFAAMRVNNRMEGNTTRMINAEDVSDIVSGFGGTRTLLLKYEIDVPTARTTAELVDLVNDKLGVE